LSVVFRIDIIPPHTTMNIFISVFYLLALVLPAQIPVADHPGQYDRADIETGSRLYSTQCVACHGPNGDMINGVDLRRGQFRSAASDEELARLLAGGRPDAGMPAFGTLQAREMTGIIAFIRAGFDANATAVKIGDPARGQMLFSGKGGCTMCHRVNGRGPRLTTDLSDIGAIRSAASLQRMLLDPAGSLIPANRSLRAVTRDGKTIRGRRLNEDTFTIQLIDEQERLVSLTKSELRSLEMISTSAMPSYATTLTAGEISDVIAYLLTLKGL
jgi:putative heme-binding domain-containing protein